MINSVYKKFAVSKGLNVSNGVAYGSLDGYATTLSEGAGFKRIDVTTYFEDVDDLKALEQELNAVDLKREYRITQIAINQRSINIIFYDNPGTMKKLTAFVEYFYPLLAKYNAATSSYCPDCKQEIFDGTWLDSGENAQIINGEITVKPFSYGTSYSTRIMKFKKQ